MRGNQTSASSVFVLDLRRPGCAGMWLRCGLCCLTGLPLPLILSASLIAADSLAVRAQERTSNPAQTSSADWTQSAPVDLIAALHLAAQNSRLDNPVHKPWHLKLDVQNYNAKGHPSGQATIEEWWSPDSDKRVYTSGSYMATEVRIRGKLFRTTTQPSPPYPLGLLRDAVVVPIPYGGHVLASQPVPMIKRLDGVQLQCIQLDPEIDGIDSAPVGFFTTYCLNPDSPQLVATYQFVDQSIIRQALQTFQSRSVARDTLVRSGNRLVATAHLSQLELWMPADQSNAPGTGLVPVQDEPLQLDPAEMAKGLRSTVSPDFSQLGPDAPFAEGPVKLGVRIGTDGRIREFQVLQAPNLDVALIVIAAVRQWTYKPFKLNGLPIEADGTITLTVSLRVTNH